MLCDNVTYSTLAHGIVPYSVRTVSCTAIPACAIGQQFSITLPSNVTYLAFFSSKLFFTTHAVPAYVGSSFFQESGLKIWLCLMTMFDGIMLAIDVRDPPNMMFSPDASR